MGPILNRPGCPAPLQHPLMLRDDAEADHADNCISIHTPPKDRDTFCYRNMLQPASYTDSLTQIWRLARGANVGRAWMYGLQTNIGIPGPITLKAFLVQWAIKVHAKYNYMKKNMLATVHDELDQPRHAHRYSAAVAGEVRKYREHQLALLRRHQQQAAAATDGRAPNRRSARPTLCFHRAHCRFEGELPRMERLRAEFYFTEEMAEFEAHWYKMVRSAYEAHAESARLESRIQSVLRIRVRIGAMYAGQPVRRSKHQRG